LRKKNVFRIFQDHPNLSRLRLKLGGQLKYRIFRTSSGNKVVVVYSDSNAPALSLLFDRLKQIVQRPVRGIADLMHELKDNRNSLFPQGQLTESMNRAATAVNQGKYLIMLEGEERWLIMPVDLFSIFRINWFGETHWLSFLGLPLLGILAMMIAAFLPALFLVVISYEYYLVPINFISPLTDSLLQMPFSPALMTLIVGILFDMFFTAAFHRKSNGKMTVLICGGLLAFSGAIVTGMLNGGLIAVYGISAIAALVLPNPDLTRAIQTVKYAAIILGAVFGILGVVVTASLTVAHLVALTTLEQPYLSIKSLLSEEGWSETIQTNEWKKGDWEIRE
jgi:spore germination protein